MRFDRVIANPSVQLGCLGHDTAGADAHGRFRFGLPPKTRATWPLCSTWSRR